MYTKQNRSGASGSLIILVLSILARQSTCAPGSGKLLAKGQWEICGNYYDKADFIKKFETCVKELGVTVGAALTDVLKGDKPSSSFFDNPEITKNACLITCIMEKSGMNAESTDTSMAQEKLEKLFTSANKPDPSGTAAKIIQTCLPLDTSNTEGEAKCKKILDTAACVAKEVVQACGDGEKA